MIFRVKMVAFFDYVSLDDKFERSVHLKRYAKLYIFNNSSFILLKGLCSK